MCFHGGSQVQACATTLKGRLVTFSQSFGIYSVANLLCANRENRGRIPATKKPPAFGGKAGIEIYAVVAWFVVLVVL